MVSQSFAAVVFDNTSRLGDLLTQHSDDSAPIAEYAVRFTPSRPMRLSSITVPFGTQSMPGSPPQTWNDSMVLRRPEVRAIARLYLDDGGLPLAPVWQSAPVSFVPPTAASISTTPVSFDTLGRVAVRRGQSIFASVSLVSVDGGTYPLQEAGTAETHHVGTVGPRLSVRVNEVDDPSTLWVRFAQGGAWTAFAGFNPIALLVEGHALESADLAPSPHRPPGPLVGNPPSRPIQPLPSVRVIALPEPTTALAAMGLLSFVTRRRR